MLRNIYILVHKIIMDTVRPKFERKLSIKIFVNLLIYLKYWLNKMAFRLEKITQNILTFLCPILSKNAKKMPQTDQNFFS